MKVLFGIFKALVVILAIVYFSSWGFINIRGAGLLEEKAKEFANKDISVDGLRFLPPLGISINNLSSDNAKAEEIKISLSLLRIITGTIGFNTILVRDANLGIVKEDGRIIAPIVPLPGVSKEPSGVSGGVGEEKGLGGRRPVFIGRLELDNVSVDFKDKSQEDNFQGSLYGINATVDNLSIPLDNKTFFKLTSAFKSGDLLLENNLDFNGWVDFSTKSMDAALEIKRIPYVIFSAYYPKNWKPDNLGIEEAVFSLKSTLKAQDNDLTVEGTLSLLDYKFRQGKEGSTRASMIEAVLGMFSRGKEYPEFDFEFRTKFDEPQFDFTVIKAQAQSTMKGITLTIGRELIKDAAGMPKEGVEKMVDVGKDTTKKAVDVATKAIGEVLKSPETAKDIMKEAGRTLKGMFTLEEEELQEQEQQPQE